MHDGSRNRPTAATDRNEGSYVEYSVMLCINGRGVKRRIRMDDKSSVVSKVMMATKLRTEKRHKTEHGSNQHNTTRYG